MGLKQQRLRLRRLLVTNLATLVLVSNIGITAHAAVTTNLTFVNISENYSEQNYNSFLNYYLLIPLNVRERLQINGWKINLTTDNLGDDPYGQVVGKTVYNYKNVYLENNKYGSKAILHEVGHIVDYYEDEEGKMCWHSNSEEWQSIFEEEKGNLRAYGQSLTIEGFADCFEQIILNGANFQKKCPKSYNYITNIMNSIQGLEETVQ
jgi:hypothetical protein